MDIKVYRVYAEEKVVKTYQQDVIASSKEEAIEKADNNKDYHTWEVSDDIGAEEGSSGIGSTFARTLEKEESSHMESELEDARLEYIDQGEEQCV
jgi:hypothetical protein|tara:strand:+ start:1340 stop:1624 length:285 start_codon:yes stop_codon:yes gene_type:complete